jgi:hypothetical protein
MIPLGHQVVLAFLEENLKLLTSKLRLCSLIDTHSLGFSPFRCPSFNNLLHATAGGGHFVPLSKWWGVHLKGFTFHQTSFLLWKLMQFWLAVTNNKLRENMMRTLAHSGIKIKRKTGND